MGSSSGSVSPLVTADGVPHLSANSSEQVFLGQVIDPAVVLVRLMASDQTLDVSPGR
jgi:hypothetical protein